MSELVRFGVSLEKSLLARFDVLIRVTDTQHAFQEAIISTQHIHLDHHNCLEIVAARGKAEEVRKLADALRSIKGVRHATLSMSSTGREIE